MIAKIALAAFAAVAAATASAAAEPPPPVSTVGDAVRILQAQGPQGHYATHCETGHPSVSLAHPQVERVVLLPDDGGLLTLVACIDSRKIGVPHAIDSISLALTVLAYKPFAPFWPEAEARWGADLAVLRQDLHERAQQATASGLRSGLTVRDATATARTRAATLTQLGYFDEAQAVYSAQRDELLRARAAGEPVDFDLVSLTLSQAASVRLMAGSAAAADFLARFASTVPVRPGDAINVSINRAAYLAEAGRHAEALALLAPAYEAFREDTPDGSYKISGSDREFAWIFACVHWHMGEARASRRYESIVTSADERPRDRGLRMTKTTTDIKQRMYRCMNKPAGYFAAWRGTEEAILSSAWLEFQQRGERPQTGVPRGWGALPEAQELAKDYRELPEQYLPALTLWRDSGGATP